MKGKFLSVIVVVVLLLLVAMPVGAQAEATPEATPYEWRDNFDPDEIVTLQTLVYGPGIPGTLYRPPVVGERLVPDIRPQDEVLAMVDQMIADAIESQMVQSSVFTTQAQAIDDAPPVTVDDEGRYQLILLTFGAVFVIFAGTLAYFGKLLFDSIPPALQDTMEYTLKRVADGAVTGAGSTPAKWDDELAQYLRDQVEGWFEEWRKVNQPPFEVTPADDVPKG